MNRRRWWHSGEHSVEAEAAWFSEAGLDFRLDEPLLEQHEVVVFRGQLRLSDKRTTAVVIYPPAYDAGEQPIVAAPDGDIGRHRAPNGALCLDHPVLGEATPMCGAEAVERAERLWQLWENDRAQLHEEEADAPDPWAHYVDYTAGTGVIMEVPAELGDQGYFDLGLSSLIPFRGALVGIRQTHPTAASLEVPASNHVFAGDYRVPGIWKRIPAPPPDPRSHVVVDWLRAEQRPMVEQGRRFAQGHDSEEMPTLLAFIYPDEGPERGQTHDAWLLVVIRSNNAFELPEPFLLRADERWLRQPQLSHLAQQSVAILGAGALGSQVATSLARAGVGRLILVDHDVVMPGNRVRHELDLADVGRPKAVALADRLRRTNPWCQVEGRVHRFGHISDPMLGAVQAADDSVADLLVGSDLIVNASAHTPSGYHLAAVAREAARPVIHAWVSPGAWGGRILVQREEPHCSGCPQCLALWQEQAEEGSADVQVPAVASDPSGEEVLERGCADPTFTGPGFELTAAAAATARVVIQVLSQGSEGAPYPAADFDLLTLDFRGPDRSRLESHYSDLPVHPACPACRD